CDSSANLRIVPSSYGPRYLLPPPTRRSSDLPTPVNPTNTPAGPGPSTPTQGEGVEAVSTCVDPTAIGPTPIRRISAVEYANAVRDRKSTRLNSSHVKISYAVFCLYNKYSLSP